MKPMARSYIFFWTFFIGVFLMLSNVQTAKTFAGVPGSIAEWGNDLVNNYLNTIEGVGEITEPIINEYFVDFGPDVAGKSTVYNKIENAKNASDAAAANPDNAELAIKAAELQLDAIKETLKNIKGSKYLSEYVLKAFETAIEQVEEDLEAARDELKALRLTEEITEETTTTAITTTTTTTTTTIYTVSPAQ